MSRFAAFVLVIALALASALAPPSPRTSHRTPGKKT